MQKKHKMHRSPSFLLQICSTWETKMTLGFGCCPPQNDEKKAKNSSCRRKWKAPQHFWVSENYHFWLLLFKAPKSQMLKEFQRQNWKHKSLNIMWLLSNFYPTVFCLLPDYFLTVIQLLSDCFSSVKWMLSNC